MIKHVLSISTFEGATLVFEDEERSFRFKAVKREVRDLVLRDEVSNLFEVFDCFIILLQSSVYLFERQKRTDTESYGYL
jgi:hypothetical protein